MTPERWLRIKTLFALIAEAPAETRTALLAREAGDDAALIAEVESLLAQHDAPDDALDIPAKLREKALAAEQRGHLGERIGAYRIVEQIGTGGMGDVFKAVRDDDQYRAEVAIKLMRSDVRNPLAEQRFRTERQILAALDHRNIARLLDGGSTPGGLPYVVMELVTGEPIDKYCDGHTLPTRERVGLFLQVCAAVSYAHQHLVVHRDLKPNNILVTADGSVKLLDFGIAKLLEPDTLTGPAADVTRTQLRAMTLDYASPEQVSGGVVSTVSDVYSLGVVLYRLITGQSPYRALGGDAARVVEILGDTSPTRPSAVTTRERRAVEGDLDDILLMALRKEPAKRYGSVEQLAADLRNYLGGRPVNARRGTFAYRAGKFARRNTAAIAAAVLVTVSLVAGLGIAIREAHEAELQRAVAQRHFDSVRSLANKLIDFNEEIKNLPDSTKAQETLVNTALKYLDTLFQGAGSDAALQEEVGIAYAKVAHIQGSQMGSNRGDPKAALATYAKSNALLDPLLEANPDNAKLGAFVADSLMRQARTLLYTQGPEPALAAAQRAVRLSEAARRGFESEVLYVATLTDSHALVAQSYGALGRAAEARAPIGRMVSISEEYSNAHPDDEAGLRGLAKAYINSAITDIFQETLDERRARAEPLLRKAMTVQERLIASDPKRELYRWNLAETRYNLGDILFDSGDYANALVLFRAAAAVMARHDPDDARAVLISTMNDVSFGKTLYQMRQLPEAEAVLDRVAPKLKAMLAQGRTVQNEFFLALVCSYRGYIFMEWAQQPRADAGESSRNWIRARDSLREGAGYFKNVNATMELLGIEKQLWDDGLAALAKAEAALARR